MKTIPLLLISPTFLITPPAQSEMYKWVEDMKLKSKSEEESLQQFITGKFMV